MAVHTRSVCVAVLCRSEVPSYERLFTMSVLSLSLLSPVLFLSLRAHSAGELDEKFYERDSAAVNAARRDAFPAYRPFTSAAVYIGSASFFSPAALSLLNPVYFIMFLCPVFGLLTDITAQFCSHGALSSAARLTSSTNICLQCSLLTFSLIHC